MSRDDEYWYTVFKAVVAEFREHAEALVVEGRTSEAIVWRAASDELDATVEQALKTANTAERLVDKGRPH